MFSFVETVLGWGNYLAAQHEQEEVDVVKVLDETLLVTVKHHKQHYAIQYTDYKLRLVKPRYLTSEEAHIYIQLAIAAFEYLNE